MLDDLWNDGDEAHFNFLPQAGAAEEAAGSRVLISTRVRGLLNPDRPGGVAVSAVAHVIAHMDYRPT